MPTDADFSLATDLWPLITRFGESQLMLPSALLLVAWLAWAGMRRSAVWWIVLLAVAIGLTAASKIAFIGWGVGIPRFNFTGFSGHAMFASVVFPLLLRCVAASGSRRVQHVAVGLGYAMAALVAVSRVMVGAHSPSEALAGFALGSAASALALAVGTVPQKHLPRWLLAALVAGYVLNPAAAPSLPTHDMVTQIALWMSGNEKPYTRRMMMRGERERQKALEQPTALEPAPVRAPPYNGSAVVFFTSSTTA